MWDSRDGYPGGQAGSAYPADAAVFYIHLLISVKMKTSASALSKTNDTSSAGII